MNLKFMKYTFLIATVLLLLSCEDEKPQRFSPYNATNYDMPDGIKSLVEQRLDRKDNFVSETRTYFAQNGRIDSIVTEKDGKKRLQRFDYSEKSGRILFFYDSEDEKQNHEFYYSKEGDLDRESYNLEKKNGTKEFRVTYEYNTCGVVIKRIEYDGDNTWTTESKYQDDGTLSLRTETDGSNKIEYACDESGNIVNQFNYDSRGKLKCSYTFEYEYDSTGYWKTRRTYNEGKLLSTNQRCFERYQAQTKGTGSNTIDKIITVTSEDKVPSKTIFIVLSIITLITSVIALIIIKSSGFYTNFLGKYQENGMKRMWMYNKEPYVQVGGTVGVVFLAFIGSILLLLLVGALTWGLLWLAKLLLIILVWIGYISLVIGIIGLIGRTAYGCLPLVLGGLIVYFEDELEQFGKNLVAWGEKFLDSVNLIEWGTAMVTEYWKIILTVFLVPLSIFLAIGLLCILIDGLLMGIEWIVMRVYSVKRPCPVCGSTGTPNYIINGNAHPVGLHPGLYGIFSQRVPQTKVRIPTMLLFGKGRLIRQCRHCHSMIDSGNVKHTYGTDIHIGIVGHRSSGKSYLLYSGLNLICNKLQGKIEQIDSTSDTAITAKANRVANGDDIQTAVSDNYRAVQLMYHPKTRPVPYHMFFYDVAGEKFDVSKDNHKTAMEYYGHVESIAFVVDPTMIDGSMLAMSPKLQQWISLHGSHEKYNIESNFAVLREILESVGRNSHHISINFVLTKCDLGYLSALNYDTNTESARNFLTNELGLINLINAAEAAFGKVEFFAVSTKNEQLLDSLFTTILKQCGVKID